MVFTLMIILLFLAKFLRECSIHEVFGFIVIDMLLILRNLRLLGLGVEDGSFCLVFIE
jgi:hypothetical protein